MPRRLALWLGLALGFALSTPAAAAEPVPPGEGMVAQPCPANGQGLWAQSPYVLKYDWAWRCRFQEENRTMDSQPPRVVFMGDSITEGWSKLDPDFFARGYANRGISGQTSAQMLVRFYQDVVALHPKVVHIMAGTNDVAGNGGPTTAEQYHNTIRSMVDIARANAIQVVIGAIPPADRFSWNPAIKPALQIADLNRWLRDYAKANGLAFADYYTAMAGPNGELLPAYATDGVHPIAAGYAVMRPIAERAIAEAEGRAKARSKRR